MQPELTSRVDLSSTQNRTMELDNQRNFGDDLGIDPISKGQVYKSKERIFVICDACFWATTYLDKSRLPVLESRCSRCQEVGLSSFPVLVNESFTFSYSEKRGVELRFLNSSGQDSESRFTIKLKEDQVTTL